jgi:hypothetical protein
MAEKRGIQKTTILKENIPPLSIFPDGDIGHYVRYRIASKDRNRFSHWSPLYQVKVPAFTTSSTPVSVAYDPINKTVFAVWGDEYTRPTYDVFVRWGNMISQVSSAGTTRTITTTSTHNFIVGDKITLSLTSAYVNAVHFNTSLSIPYHEITEVTPTTFKFVISTNPQTIANYSMGVTPGNAAFYNYYYHGSPTIHTYSFLKTGTAVIDNSVRVLDNFTVVFVDIQISSIDKIGNDKLLIFASPISTGYVLT